MGKQSNIDPQCRSGKRILLAAVFCFLVLTGFVAVAQTPTSAAATPLLLPAGLLYDAAGNLLFAESGRHLIRRVSPAGLLTTFAGTGTQGFGGDGGPATAALLDTPTALALDAGGDVFFADSHNHRIRRIDALTGVITTKIASVDAAALAVDAAGNLFFADFLAQQIRRMDAVSGAISTVAGTGTQGFSGDGGPALAASLDTPSGLAVTATGDLFLADSHNRRIRRIAAGTGVITTVTTSAALPKGLTLDPSGNLLFADKALQQILRVDANGAVSVLAGTSVQSFAGDGSPAPLALLDSPQSVTLSPAGLPTLADTANGRIRQVDAASIIHTIAGIGSSSSATLALTGPSVVLYGTGSVTATLAASPASGSVTLFDEELQAAPQTLGSEALIANAASFSTATLAAGAHRLLATYSGDPLHPSAESTASSLSVTPAPVSASPVSFSILFGQPVPVLSGTLVGVLPQDTSSVSLILVSKAGPLSPPASYPITAALSGAAAGNYSLTAGPASVTIAKAPAAVSLNTSGAPAIAVQVASTTAGLPSGTVTLLDGSAAYGALALSGGAATFNVGNLSPGTHTLTAAYSGDVDFLAVSSVPAVLNIAPASLPDFTLVANGQTSVTVPTGSAAQYSFAVTPANGGLASPILLAASGLPAGATASFNPAYLPPGNTSSAFTLTITTPKAELLPLRPVQAPFEFALLVPLLVMVRRRPRRACLLAALALMIGCGDRVNNTAASVSTTAYTITVTATGTQSTGGSVQHTAVVTLNVQQ